MRSAKYVEQFRNREGLTYGFGRSALPGIYTIEVMHTDWGTPIGCVWYRQIGANKIIEITQSFIREDCRRCGLRTYLHEKLQEAYPEVTKIITGGGTKEGRKWMLATGYRKTEDGWTFTVKGKNRLRQRR